MKNLLLKQILFTSLLVLAIGCGGDDDDGTPAPTADFTFEVTGFTVDFTNASKNFKSVSWDFGDDSDAETTENPSHTYDQAGDYDVTLTVTGNDNSTKTATKTVTIAEPVDVLVGGDMSDETDWTAIAVGLAPTTYSFEGDQLTFTGEGQLNMLIYQAVELTPGTYQVQAHVNATSLNGTWVEFYLLNTEPVEGTDVSNPIIAWKTFAEGCTNTGIDSEITAFDSCLEGSDIENGKITVTTAGTYYFGIKSGTYDGSLGDGLIVDDVKLLKY